MIATRAVHRMAWCTLGGILLGGLPGCSAKSALDRLPLEGKLSMAAVPAERLNGSLSLLPLKEGPAANAPIRQGTYRFTAQTGPVAGKYHAVVTLLPGGSKLEGLTKPADKSKPAAKPDAERTSWTFEIEVAADALERDFDVDKLALPDKSRGKPAGRP